MMNSYILHLETSTEVCSACLSKDGELLAIKENQEGFIHSAMLTVFIQDCLKELGIEMKDLAAVSVSAGPGSYTGLRVAYAVAKGICYGLKIPLISIPTLKAMAHSFKSKHAGFNLYVPMLDARRNEVYTIAYNESFEEIIQLRSLIIEEGAFDNQKGKIAFLGNGAFKMKSHLKEAGEIFDWNCSAAHQIKLAQQKLIDKDFDEVAYAVPLYLKPPNITVPKPLL